MDPKMIKHPPQINAHADIIDGIYSNVFFVALSRSEFVLDFAKVVPGRNSANLKSRIIISPHRVKALIKTLETQVNVYEGKFGKLDSENLSAFGFQNPVTLNEEEGRR